MWDALWRGGIWSDSALVLFVLWLSMLVYVPLIRDRDYERDGGPPLRTRVAEVIAGTHSRIAAVYTFGWFAFFGLASCSGGV